MAKKKKNQKKYANKTQKMAPVAKRDNKKLLALCGAGAVVVLAVVLILAFSGKSGGKTEGIGTYSADIVIRDYGTVTVELDGDTAPITVRNFVDLAESGFYDGLTFHRVVEGFMAQGGDPRGDGYGNAGTTIVGEFKANGHENNISHVRGTISMARGGNSYNSASCQFFIVHQDATFLDGQYAAFGHVVSGMEFIDAICEAAGPVDRVLPADEQPVIESITIRR